jgi:hypothetical protein
MSVALRSLIARLASNLTPLGFTTAQLAVVSSDVENRLRSLLSRWGNESLRRTLLFHGVEEATFYDPKDGDHDCRALIVVAIRNSLLEDFASTKVAAHRWGAPGPLVLDGAIHDITSDLLELVLSLDLKELAETVTAPPSDLDPFAGLDIKYPLAFKAMGEAAALVGVKKVYTALPASSDSILDADGGVRAKEIKHISAKLSGIDGKIDEGLAELLANAVAEKIPFVVFPCFKGCTRNPEKLYRVINELLNHEIAFVTPNYFLSNGYVARRRTLLRPFHSPSEFLAQVADHSGLTRRHREALSSLVV